MSSLVSRRLLLLGTASLSALALAGCAEDQEQPEASLATPNPIVSNPLAAPANKSTAAGPAKPGDFAAMYGPINDDKFPIPGTKLSEIDPAFLRKEVDYKTNEPVGTIVIDPQHHYLYHVEEGGKAMRYGVGVGREGFAWSGEATINFKREWPDWYPPKEMLQRQPELKKKMAQLQSGLGMAGGPGNPLGVRAMYLWQGNVDTLFRIHGTVEPWSIGKSVSSGCIRMVNQDVVDLYQRVPVGTRVIVLGNKQPATVARL
ncbi:L,D-transpeptidase [Beijerinckia indica]|uniref:ErfK/YbiS/YcfS/YnhG family protein n=1 Tax=Beijerinckia indica subsp. indica (strain ATCC 9039 / DSM 1715 / NCIMB 8712) TaxID=395963 RepID=B2IE82_BEII9|nr:L,D-transpeptidase [Beijerinckia indica]ACB94106.1 ErfK/YbiS/YcfS/YnhG family protein [Beijerinckia indica subsp. indica ATCC 9039]